MVIAGIEKVKWIWLRLDEGRGDLDVWKVLCVVLELWNRCYGDLITICMALTAYILLREFQVKRADLCRADTVYASVTGDCQEL